MNQEKIIVYNKEDIFESIVEEQQMPYRYEIYRDKRILLFQGDVRNRDVFDKEFIDLIIISSPYNVGIEYNSNDDELTYDEYLDFTRLWVKNYYDWNKSQARFLLDILLHKKKEGQKSAGADITKIVQEVGWKYHSTIIWNERNISRRTVWGPWLSVSASYVIVPVELILVLYKDEWKK